MFKARFSLCFIALVGSSLLLTGCGKKEDPDPATPPPSTSTPPPSQPTPAGKVRVEFRPPDSGERLRRHIYAPDGITEVELQIEYIDGRMGYQYFRRDGSLRESKETHPGGKVLKQHVFFDADGKTILKEKKYRFDATLESDFEVLPDGTKQTTAYRLDGKRLFSVELVRADSSSEKTYFQKDGVTLWAKFTTPAGGTREVEYYGADGKLEHRRKYRSDNGMDITAYRPDGTVSIRQSWRLSYGGWYYRGYALDWSEEYAADGTTLVRKFVMTGYYGRDVREVHVYNPDGTKSAVRYFRADGTVEKVEFLDKAGKVTKTETHSSSDGIRESYDPSLVKEPTFDDPSDPYRRRDD